MNSQFSNPQSLRQWFQGLVEQAFMVELGICDTRLTGYLSNLLVDFIHMDRLFRAQDVGGEQIRDISRLQAEASLPALCSESQRTRLLNRYIGDVSLFWIGVYPEALRSRRHHGADRLREILLQGKRSYNIASELTQPEDNPPGALLANLSEQFEYCAHGLHLVRETWEKQAQN